MRGYPKYASKDFDKKEINWEMQYTEKIMAGKP